MTKAPTPTEKSKKQRENTKTPPKNFDYTKKFGIKVITVVLNLIASEVL